MDISIHQEWNQLRSFDRPESRPKTTRSAMDDQRKLKKTFQKQGRKIFNAAVDRNLANQQVDIVKNRINILEQANERATKRLKSAQNQSRVIRRIQTDRSISKKRLKDRKQEIATQRAKCLIRYRENYLYQKEVTKNARQQLLQDRYSSAREVRMQKKQIKNQRLQNESIQLSAIKKRISVENSRIKEMRQGKKIDLNSSIEKAKLDTGIKLSQLKEETMKSFSELSKLQAVELDLKESIKTKKSSISKETDGLQSVLWNTRSVRSSSRPRTPITPTSPFVIL